MSVPLLRALAACIALSRIVFRVWVSAARRDETQQELNTDLIGPPTTAAVSDVTSTETALSMSRSAQNEHVTSSLPSAEADAIYRNRSDVRGDNGEDAPTVSAAGYLDKSPASDEAETSIDPVSRNDSLARSWRATDTDAVATSEGETRVPEMPEKQGAPLNGHSSERLAIAERETSAGNLSQNHASLGGESAASLYGTESCVSVENPSDQASRNPLFAGSEDENKMFLAAARMFTLISILLWLGLWIWRVASYEMIVSSLRKYGNGITRKRRLRGPLRNDQFVVN
eukprot:TRINITY_DN19820_c0_g1_i1.p1 TRINITY_DN19820_c0_g1~~TRINITY_DN19820_c0_g1_i1.p1  ORF type:complete len:286 (-),score=27.89 TRINITY_DN19820_c0_g1_i1:109-966(-)